ncbi:MAG: Leucine-rich repeat-containing protein 23 [Marteilia pararefringens]
MNFGLRKPSGDEGNDAEISGAKAADSNAPTEAEESLEEEIRRKKEGVLSVARIKKEKCIDMLQRTFDASSVAYIRLDCSRKSLKDISILENYQHLRFINLSNNQLEDVSPVNICRHLLVLNVDNNLIETLELRDCLYMKVLSAAHNKLSKFSGMPVCVANLVNLNLNGNNIDDSLENLPKMDRLKRLQIRGNKLNTLEMSTPNLASLEEIFAADNEIDSIKIDRQAAPQSLRLLHLRDNKLDGSPGTSISDTFKKLKYLNLRNNRIEKLDQLESLIKNHPNLEKLILKDNHSFVYTRILNSQKSS